MLEKAGQPVTRAERRAKKRYDEYHPVDYSKPVQYTDGPQVLPEVPEINGVYMLTEGGQYYIGQSVDVAARYCSHRFYPCSCHFTNPRAVLLASVPKPFNTWGQNNHVRLIAEARFIAAALQLGLDLTNTLSEYKKDQLLARFPDLTEERARIKKAIQILC